MAIFRAKRVLGTSTRGERAYLVNELTRLLELGRISPSVHITAAGRYDGAGAQAMAKMSALALALHFGITYVHTPFRTMEHPEDCSPEQWALRWERFLNIGQEEVGLADCMLPQVPIEEFIAESSWWDRPCLLSAGHFTRFTDQHPQAYANIASILQRKFGLPERVRGPEHEVIVCAHLRRGDVSPDNPNTSHRLSNPMNFLSCLKQIHSALGAYGVKVRTKVYSQGSEEGLEMLQSLGCELHLDTPAIETFRQLVDADVLVMGRSSFSFTAALLCRGLCVYDRFARAPLPDWLTRDSDGYVQAEALAVGLGRLPQLQVS
jgi:hypothetical protein